MTAVPIRIVHELIAVPPSSADGSYSWKCSCGLALPLGYRSLTDAMHAGALHADQSNAISYADPTGHAATTPPQPDPVRRDARKLLNHLTDARNSLAAAHALLNQPDISETNGDPGCESCARITAPNGKPVWEPPDIRRKGKTTVGGRLKEPMLLCRWCSDQVGINGDTGNKNNPLPTRDELAVHLTGKQLRRPA
jgi:hypothetical protein